jgi:hypothetical protein
VAVTGADALAALDTGLKLIEVIGIVGGGGLILIRLGRTTGRVELAMKQQADEIKGLKDEMKVVNTLLTDVAVQKQRLDTMDARMDTLDRRYDELRHGDGFVRGARGIDREYTG